MKKNNFKKLYGLTLGHLNRGSRTSYSFRCLAVGLWIIFGANLLLNMVGLSIAGMNRLGLGNVFRVFVIITLISLIPVIIITIIQLATLGNGILHPAYIYDVTRDRNHLVVKYRYSYQGNKYYKSRLIKCKDNVDLTYFEKEKEESIVINSSNPGFLVFVNHSFIRP